MTDTSNREATAAVTDRNSAETEKTTACNAASQASSASTASDASTHASTSTAHAGAAGRYAQSAATHRDNVKTELDALDRRIAGLEAQVDPSINYSDPTDPLAVEQDRIQQDLATARTERQGVNADYQRAVRAAEEAATFKTQAENCAANANRAATEKLQEQIADQTEGLEELADMGPQPTLAHGSELPGSLDQDLRVLEGRAGFTACTSSTTRTSTGGKAGEYVFGFFNLKVGGLSLSATEGNSMNLYIGPKKEYVVPGFNLINKFNPSNAFVSWLVNGAKSAIGSKVGQAVLEGKFTFIMLGGDHKVVFLGPAKAEIMMNKNDRTVGVKVEYLHGEEKKTEKGSKFDLVKTKKLRWWEKAFYVADGVTWVLGKMSEKIKRTIQAQRKTENINVDEIFEEVLAELREKIDNKIVEIDKMRAEIEKMKIKTNQYELTATGAGLTFEASKGIVIARKKKRKIEIKPGKVRVSHGSGGAHVELSGGKVTCSGKGLAAFG